MILLDINLIIFWLLYSYKETNLKEYKKHEKQNLKHA